MNRMYPLGSITAWKKYADFCYIIHNSIDVFRLWIKLSVAFYYLLKHKKSEMKHISCTFDGTQSHCCYIFISCAWWNIGRHPDASILRTSSKETVSALLALCAGNSLVTGELPSQRPVTRSFVFSCDLSALRTLLSLSVCLSVRPSVTPLYPAALKGSGVLSYPERTGGRQGRQAPLILSRPLKSRPLLTFLNSFFKL